MDSSSDCQKFLVSIVMPAYNADQFISMAIESVIGQTYRYWELIIVNDASNDKTGEIMNRYASLDARIRPVHLAENCGVAEARNMGIGIASGSFLAFLDADDVWYGDKLDKQLDLMRERKVNCCHSYYFRSDRHGGKKLVTSPLLVTYRDMLSVNHIANSTAIYNLSVLGKFYQRAIGHEDYDMWLRMLRHTDSACVATPLVEYRAYGNTLSSNLFRGLIWHWNIIKNEENLTFFSSILFMLKYVFFAAKKRL